MSETPTSYGRCPICDGRDLWLGLTCRRVPAHSVVLRHSRDDAVSAPCGNVELAACENCGFVFNATYDPRLHHYSDQYESTQSFSETFNAFNERLAGEIAEKTGRRDALIVEIGCGQGEFLHLLRKRGCDKLVGFDPAYDMARSTVTGGPGIEIVARAFDPGSFAGAPRAIVCKMTLEHIARPVAMLQQIAELASRSSCCEIFVQVPNAEATFSLSAFWDIYYEHCNYFTSRTLVHALRRANLEPSSIARVFGDQYIVANAQSAIGQRSQAANPAARSELVLFRRFCQVVGNQVRQWRERIRGWARAGERIMLWGGGSKAVAFTSFTRTEAYVLAAIDINPRKSNTFLPGSGLPVLSPDQAKSGRPTLIVLLNSAYRAEVERECSHLDIEATIVEVAISNGTDAALTQQPWTDD